MASKGSLFNAIKKSNQDFIDRYHTTMFDNVPAIFDKGIKPRIGTYQKEVLKPDQLREAVFLSADKNLYPSDDLHYRLKLRIPKTEYRKLRQIRNPETNEDFELRRTTVMTPGDARQHEKLYSILDRKEHPFARTEVIEDEIKPEWIDEVCVGDLYRTGKETCLSPDNFRKIMRYDFDEYNKTKDETPAGFDFEDFNGKIKY